MPKKRQPRASLPKKIKSISHGWARDDDPIYKQVKGTYRGLVPDTDPIYTNAGWNFLMGKNLNPHIKPKKEKGPH